jgi:hypothetical protein
MSATLNRVLAHIRNPRKAFLHNHRQEWRFRFKRMFEALHASKIRDRKRVAQALDPAQVRFHIPREKGYIRFPENAFDEVDEILGFVRELVRKFETEGGGDANWRKGDSGKVLKEHLNTTLFRAHLDQLTPNSPFLKFAIHEDLLEAVSDYLGEVPRLNFIEVWYSRATNGQIKSSQLHHLDAEYPTQAKVFIYASDVLEDGDGALSFYDSATSQRMAREIGYKGGGRVTDDTLAALERGSELVRLKGKVGDVAMIDTGMNFHFGSRIRNKDKPRITVAFHYLPYLSYKKWYEFNSLIREYHTPIQRLALDSKGVDFSTFKGSRY